MRHHRFSRSFLLAAIVSLPGLLSGGMAHAQGVQIFDQAPTLEQLRSIIIPESNGTLTRRIVFPDAQSAAVAAPAAQQAPAAAAAQTAEPSKVALADSPPPEPHAASGVVGFRINFALDSDVIPASGRAFVERIGELMQQEPQLKLRIEGHTDARGSDDYNLGLSKRRAIAVAAYLVDEKGISPDRLAVVGKGKTEPMTDDPFDALNRRVQFARMD
jgi:outer membrane protein OmpA-like peptidoglycan-associated protein